MNEYQFQILIKQNGSVKKSSFISVTAENLDEAYDEGIIKAKNFCKYKGLEYFHLVIVKIIN